MKKILVATVKPFAPAAVVEIKEVVEKAGYEFHLFEKYPEQADFVNAVKGMDALIIRSDKVTAEVLENADQLKIVVRAGAGYDNVDLEAATAKGVVVMNTPGQNSNAVAELAIGMMVYHARNGYNGKAGTELRGKKIGIHAVGNVGLLVAKIAQGFGMEVYGYDPFVDGAKLKSAGITPVDSVDDLYSSCQFISLHIPSNAETKKSIGKELLGKMPKGAVLVNTARKEVIHEEELMDLMEARPDFSYLSDIAPDCAGLIEENYSGRFFFTPKKMGAQTAEANINAGIAAAEQIRNYLEKGDNHFQVN
ncbi:MAG: 3-phosphoglycerate dehydrogenase [Bacteroidetes bacterium]|nr:3-phosphoglycerate dehydrogenase [Bacteroidota bacterium]MBT3749066.1 3-phosphoglycerate dehydrogenase [Bacteroidota bacterium]MBT4400952.1 3-phosphoglycerate dehydrogenase [Bacteroidota bacterium]MBT4408952.1 3-phosphoglycerate dehydrogenase [Bacteroidota bacterium]MBT7095703.1 3-phosphoglycerate dehydrogenase [Bacteroidota bacterium]